MTQPCSPQLMAFIFAMFVLETVRERFAVHATFLHCAFMQPYRLVKSKQDNMAFQVLKNKHTSHDNQFESQLQKTTVLCQTKVSCLLAVMTINSHCISEGSDNQGSAFAEQPACSGEELTSSSEVDCPFCNRIVMHMHPATASSCKPCQDSTVAAKMGPALLLSLLKLPLKHCTSMQQSCRGATVLQGSVVTWPHLAFAVTELIPVRNIAIAGIPITMIDTAAELPRALNTS